MKPGHEANRAGPHSSLQFVPLGGALGLEIGCRPGDEDGRALSRKMVRDAKGAPWFYGRSDMTFRIGNGFDVHAFGPGDHVTLCGIRIPHATGLVGHSDADVAMHTVTDAVYGALAMGDIGTHFPPSNPQWRGAASEIFLRHAVALARENGFRPGNVDCTIICETPKIAPYAVQMRENMASLMELGPDLISVKATTSERLGFTGRGEGIACIATCLLMAT